MSILTVLTPYLHERSHGDTSDYIFYCPGCGANHSFRVSHAEPHKNWRFNNDPLCPTFWPSLRIKGGNGVGGTVVLCHVSIMDGLLTYADDSPHLYAGKTVEMVVIP